MRDGPTPDDHLLQSPVIKLFAGMKFASGETIGEDRNAHSGEFAAATSMED